MTKLQMTIASWSF